MYFAMKSSLDLYYLGLGLALKQKLFYRISTISWCMDKLSTEKLLEIRWSKTIVESLVHFWFNYSSLETLAYFFFLYLEMCKDDL